MPEQISPRKNPCASCPYRQGVPSGIWHDAEYRKLPAYDGDISDQVQHLEQAQAVFLCHQNAREACAGWLGHRDPRDLLAVRLGISRGELDPACADYSTDTPLFASGAEAAAHGVRDLTAPNAAARRAIDKIVTVRSQIGFPVEGGSDLP